MRHSVVQERSCGSVRIFWFNAALLLERLSERVKCLDKHPEIEEVWIFGSVPAGRAVPGSDLDLMLMLSSSELDFAHRIEWYLELFDDMGVGVDVFPYLSEELGTPVAKEAMKTGRRVWKKGVEI